MANISDLIFWRALCPPFFLFLYATLAIIWIFRIYIINVESGKSKSRKVVIHMDKSKIVSVQDVPASENKAFVEVRKLSSDIIKTFFPSQKKDNVIIGSTICGVERY